MLLKVEDIICGTLTVLTHAGVLFWISIVEFWRDHFGNKIANLNQISISIYKILLKFQSRRL